MRSNQPANGSVRRGRAVACAAFVGAMFLMAAGSAGADSFNTCAGGVADSMFTGAAYKCESVTHEFDLGESGDSNDYFFDDFLFANTLSFDEVLHDDLDVTMTAFFVTPGNTAFLSRLPPGNIPEPFLTSTGPDEYSWIYFRVENLTADAGSTPPEQGVDFRGFWHQEIAWFGDGTYVSPQMLHDRRPLDTFGDVITEPGSFCSECGPPGDPTIGGGARDFSDTTVVSTPEPTSLLLLGSGLGSALYRRRRQRALAARDSA